MGTNYYHHSQAPCPACNRPHARKHIGKSSAGWCFALRVIPEDGIKTLADWRTIWAAGGYIVDEYGAEFNPEEMLAIITRRSRNPVPRRDIDFNYARNDAVPGPNNLIRHAINGHCIGHGEGTWDYIVGEFS